MIFLFDKFKKLKGTVRNRHTISLLYERERNGLYTVSAEIPLKITDKKTVYNYHKKVKDSDFLGHYDREGRFQLHKIASVDIEDSSIFIKGVHLFFDEAKAGAIIQERRFRGSEIVDGARVAFDPIGWSVVDADVSDTADYIFYNVSPLEARAILVETFDYEFDYWLDFDGKNIRNKQISIKREMGKDSNKRYNYGHNVLNIKVEQDYSEIYTAVIGRGKGEDLGDDAYGRRIEYTDVEWKTPTHPMNKPKGSRVLHDENATQLFGYHEDGKVSPRTKVEIFEDIEDPAKLLRASYNWLRENSVPKAVFSLKVPDGDGLDLGDKVHVIYRDIDLVKHTRVTKVVDDLVSGNRDVEFGDTAYFKTDRRLSGVKAQLKRVGGSMSSRISRLKAEFDRRFDNEVKQWKDDFEQALIDAEAAVEAMRVTMTEEFEAAQKAFEVEFNQSVSDAKKHADAVADEKAKQVQGNLDSFAGRHEQLVGELQGNIVNINGEIADARADVSGILGRLTGLDGRVSATEASLTVLDDEISSVVGRVSDNETNISSVVQDVNSITSTVATLEGDVATQGSQISQANDVISSKVWMDDVAEIGANLIPQSANAWEDGSFWSSGGEATDSTTRMNIRMKESIPLILGERYTLSDYSKYVSAIQSIAIHQWDDSGRYVGVSWVGREETLTFTAIGTRLRISMHAMSGFSIPTSFIGHLDERIKVKLEQGTAATPMLNAISHIQQTADKLSFKVAELSSINGEEILTQSDISIESDRIIIGSQQISSNTLASLISVSPASIDLITDKMNLTGNLNVKGQIESISTSAVKADFANIFAGTADIQFIVAKHLASDAIQARHLLVSNAMAEKIIANTVMAREVKALSLDAVEANIGSIRSKILTSDVIKSTHIAGGTALIDKIYSSTAMFERMMAKSGFVRTLNTVTIDTDQITIRRPDGGRLINNGMLQASFDVQIRPNHASSAVEFTGINYATSSSTWQTFEHFYTDHKGSKLLISWAVDFYGPSASEYIEVRVRGFGGNNPIGTSNKKIFSNGSTAYLNQTVSLGVPDYNTIQAYLEFRRSPSGSSSQNTVRARVLRVSLID